MILLYCTALSLHPHLPPTLLSPPLTPVTPPPPLNRHSAMLGVRTSKLIPHRYLIIYLPLIRKVFEEIDGEKFR
jgi:hypothetical protein